MAILVRPDPQKFAVGASMAVYASAAGWQPERASGPPPGTLVETQTVAAGGIASFTTLVYGTEYVGYASSPDRYWRFEASSSTDALLTRVAAVETSSGLVGSSVAVIKEAPLNVLDSRFGGVGNGVTDDYAAIVAAVAQCPASGGEILLPKVHKITQKVLVDNKSIRFRGTNVSNPSDMTSPSNYGSTVKAAAGITAFEFRNGVNGRGSHSGLENLHIVGSDTATGTNPGVILSANSGVLRGIVVESFGSHGIHVRSGTVGNAFIADVVYNANTFRIESARAYSNFGNGLFVEGVDSNAGVIDIDCSFNALFGIYDNSALGNVYLGPHLDGNTLGAIRIGSQSGLNRFYGVYKEGDATPALLIDAGGDGFNLVDFRYLAGLAGETITDNSGLRTNQIITGPTQGDRDDGQPGLVAGPKWATTSSVALLANVAFVARVVPSRMMRITKISFVVSTAASVNDAADVGIYDITGTRLGAKGATVGLLNSTGVKTVTLAAPITMFAGTQYYIALSCGAIGGSAATVLARTTQFADGSVIFGTTLGPVEHGYYATSHPLPASVATTPNANNTNPLVVVRVD